MKIQFICVHLHLKILLKFFSCKNVLFKKCFSKIDDFLCYLKHKKDQKNVI